LFLILLDEFCAQLEGLGRLAGIRPPKPSPTLGVWTNRRAKHRLYFMVQHHPVFLFADSFGAAWKTVFGNLPSATVTDECGQTRPVFVIDEAWLRSAKGQKPDLATANKHPQAVVAVPPLDVFLDLTMHFFRSVVDQFLCNPEAVKRFEMQPGVPCMGSRTFPRVAQHQTLAVTGMTQEPETIFLVPGEEGRYQPVRGKIHFQGGRLVKLTVKGQDWRTPGSNVNGPVVFYLMGTVRLVGQKLFAMVQKCTYAAGNFVDHEVIGEREVENDWQELCRCS
jgi:hypothetical protein